MSLVLWVHSLSMTKGDTVWCEPLCLHTRDSYVSIHFGFRSSLCMITMVHSFHWSLQWSSKWFQFVWSVQILEFQVLRNTRPIGFLMLRQFIKSGFISIHLDAVALAIINPLHLKSSANGESYSRKINKLWNRPKYFFALEVLFSF